MGMKLENIFCVIQQRLLPFCQVYFFGAAFLRAATVTNTINAATTDIKLDNNECPTMNPTSSPFDSSIKQPTSGLMYSVSTVIEPLTKKTTTNENLNEKCTPGPSASAFQTASSEILIPTTVIKQTVKRTKIKKGNTSVLTDSPFKMNLKTSLKIKKSVLKNRKRQEIPGNNVKRNNITEDNKTHENEKYAECLYCKDS
ncbi:hypothetical protein PR048_016478 [Dryococelus australis]|uniref:Uncharacterized protein n=1 Tax=Dryococelus australis TaxID=614101 RepID=A0ABQ9HJU9_9NEOP|nr:hypothetical protein PR048_016478 [Dryococelus australis]